MERNTLRYRMYSLIDEIDEMIKDFPEEGSKEYVDALIDVKDILLEKIDNL